VHVEGAGADGDTQSSELETAVLLMRTSWAFSTWMPSVWGHSVGELMDRPLTSTPRQVSNWTGLFFTLRPCTCTVTLLAMKDLSA